MLELPARADAHRLWEFFTGNGYTEESLVRELGSAEAPSPGFQALPRTLSLTRGGRPFDHLVRWFLCGLSVSDEEIGDALPEWFLPLVEGAGLLRRGEGAWLPTVLVTTYGKLLAASDLYGKLVAEDRHDHVLTINAPARYLAAFAVRQRVGTTLDLCAGNGVQALAAAPHSDRVTATDLNGRATGFAAFNARLNGFTNIECLTGDSFEPVTGRRFDRILCNPPFVLSPGRELICRENDEELDGFCRRLVRQAPEHLEEGGIFQMILEWVELEGMSWQDRVSAWFEGSGCDAIVLRSYSEEPSVYALNRLRETAPASGEIDPAAYDEWTRFFADRKVEKVHGGLLALRRRAGESWVRIDENAPDSGSPFGDAIRSTFLARDFLDGPGAEDDRLLSNRPSLAEGLRMSQDYEPSKDGWTTSSLRLRQTTGMRHEIGVDGNIASFLGRLDGERTLDDLIEETASQAGADPQSIRPQCLATIRAMIANGFVLPGVRYPTGT